MSSPLWFRAPFAVLRLFVREKLRERVCMLNLKLFHIVYDVLLSFLIYLNRVFFLLHSPGVHSESS